MELFAGEPTSDYEDLLRALGALVDAWRWRHLRLYELEDGVYLRGRPAPAAGGPPAPMGERFLPTAAVREAVRAAHRRRGQPGAPAPAGRDGRYEDALRALGAHADARGWRALRIVETPGGLLLQGLATRAGGGYRERAFAPEALHAAAAVASGRRGRPS